MLKNGRTYRLRVCVDSVDQSVVYRQRDEAKPHGVFLMRILSVIDQKPYETGSGLYMSNLVNALKNMGHEQAVVAGIMPGDPDPFSDRGIAFYPVIFNTDELPFPVMGMSDEMPYTSTRYRDMTEEMDSQLIKAYSNKLFEAVEKFRPELIICHHLYLITAITRKLFPYIKVVGVCHGSCLRQFNTNNSYREYIAEYIYRLDAIYALHNRQKLEIERLFHTDNVRVIGSAIDLNVFRKYSGKFDLPEGKLFSLDRNTADCKLSTLAGNTVDSKLSPLVEDTADSKSSPLVEDTSEAKPRIIHYVGKLSFAKGVRSFIRSLDYLPYATDELKIYMVGGPGNETEMNEINRLAASCRYEIIFTGVLKPYEIAALNNMSSCLILPSFYEGLPLVVFEAIACGIPVVMTDLPGIREWIDENVPGSCISYVPAPRMINIDEPLDDDLQAFEQALANRIEEVLNIDPATLTVPDLKNLTWEHIADKITFPVTRNHTSYV